MPKIVSFFNNKGGVGKTTLLFHVGHLLAERHHRVLMVDCDSQCNLTAYTLNENAIQRAWDEKGNSVWRAIELVYRGIGDIRDRAPTEVANGLSLLPGDLLLSSFEDLLGETWNSAKGGSEPAVRAQSALLRSIDAAAAKANADVVLVDLGPNLAALNRAVLGASDFFVTPIAPDLFSIRGTENLGEKLLKWRAEWDQVNQAWTAQGSVSVPRGQPAFIGYVTQQHNLRNNAQGMTAGWQLFGAQVDAAVRSNIVDRLSPLGQAVAGLPSYDLGKVPNLHSLIPYSLEARLPVFQCTSAQGLRGAHIEKARESRDLFAPIANAITKAAGLP